MNRYEPVVQKVMGHVDLLSPGIGIVVVAPGQHALVARVLESRLPGAVSRPLEQELLREGPARWIVTGLSGDRATVKAALSELNGRRNWISSSGRLLVLLLTNRELVEVQRLAGDVYSARLFIATVPFVSDPEVDAEAARAELARWQRNRFGRLDLRGFVRSESEDVSWWVEDVYQELRASYSMEALFGQGAPGVMQEGAVTELLDKVFRAKPERTQPVVLLGHPGSGKTFFLRWLAMTAVEQERLSGLERPLPLLTSLSAYAQSPGTAGLREHLVESLLENEQPAAHVVERAIRERRVLFLLDGLDEVGDASSRRRMAAAIEALIQEAPGCPVIVTSRIAGYDAVHLSSLNFFLSPFTDSAIERFLIRWSELYALNRLGETPQALAEGHEEGERLARDVLAHSEVRELARSPLLLTVLAMVHRAGVRLPDHRVELYEHVTRILVERWNRVRSLSRQDVSPPLKAADAVRLLGPVALKTMRLGTRGAIPEDSLRGMLQRALANGNLRGLVSAEEALELFRSSLGLLVERGPGLYAFLHLTLAEYFAARELVRTGELERIAGEPQRAFQPEWREVLLLAAGELGVIRADDERLEGLVALLLESAERCVDDPRPSVPSLLGGLLADDPGLSMESATKIIQALIPGWWFSYRYKPGPKGLNFVLGEANSLLGERFLGGRFMGVIQNQLKQSQGSVAEACLREDLADSGMFVTGICINIFLVAGVDYGPWLMEFLLQQPVDDPTPVLLAGFLLPDWLGLGYGHVDEETDSLVLRIPLNASLDRWARSKAGRLCLLFNFIGDKNNGFEPVELVSMPWDETRYLGQPGRRCDAWMEVQIPKAGRFADRIMGVSVVRLAG